MYYQPMLKSGSQDRFKCHTHFCRVIGITAGNVTLLEDKLMSAFQRTRQPSSR